VPAGAPRTLRAARRATREPAVIVFEPPPDLQAFRDEDGHLACARSRARRSPPGSPGALVPGHPREL